MLMIGGVEVPVHVGNTTIVHVRAATGVGVAAMTLGVVAGGPLEGAALTTNFQTLCRGHFLEEIHDDVGEGLSLVVLAVLGNDLEK